MQQRAVNRIRTQKQCPSSPDDHSPSINTKLAVKYVSILTSQRFVERHPSNAWVSSGNDVKKLNMGERRTI
jgi:hypothetical protein